MPISEIVNPIALEEFLQAARRKCDNVKSTTLLFDVHFKVPEFGGLARVGELIQQGQLDHLPLPLCLGGKLPPNSKMGAVIQNLEDGTMNVVKMIHFPDKVSVGHASKLCTGNAYVPVFRQGRSSVKRESRSVKRESRQITRQAHLLPVPPDKDRGPSGRPSSTCYNAFMVSASCGIRCQRSSRASGRRNPRSEPQKMMSSELASIS